MAKEHTFKQHRVSQPERTWLKEVLRAGDEFDVRETKVKLYGRLPRDFDPSDLDFRIYTHDGCQPIGRWLMAPRDPVFANADTVIRAIREELQSSPGRTGFLASEVSEMTGLTPEEVERVYFFLRHFGGFFTGAVGEPSASNRYFDPADGDQCL